MIASLTGILVSLGEQDLVIRVGGVGYRVQISRRCLSVLGGIGDEVTVLIDTQVKDDRIILTGFSAGSVRDIYLLLQTVQGVGGKAALSILSALSVDDIILSISSGDRGMIMRAEGVGGKLAQRIVNELSDKVSALGLGAGLGGGVSGGVGGGSGSDGVGEGLRDAVSALVNLGYSRGEAHSAVVQVARSSGLDTVEGLVPLALKELGR